MSTAIKDKQLELLISLQEIDQEIQKFNKLIESIPEEIERERKIFEKINTEINESKEKIEQAKKDRRSKELETQSTKEKLINSKNKLPEVKTNKEYSAILQETENLNNKINSMEEEEIELMENIEEAEKEYKIKLEEKKAEEQKFSSIKNEKEGELEKINKRLEEEINQKNALTDQVESKWFEHYKKVMNLRKGLAVVAIDKNTCYGCHHSLMPQLSLEVRKNDSIITCPHCSRFLFSEQTTGAD